MAETGIRPVVAIVGGGSLLAKEVHDLIEESGLMVRVNLIDASAQNAAETSEDEDSPVLLPLTAESLGEAAVVLLAGSAASSRRAHKLNPSGGPPLIDLTGALEDLPEARLRGPSAEAQKPEGEAGAISVIAHSASIAIAMVTAALSSYAHIRRTVVHVFEPASERGKRAIDELQKQTVSVLSFQKLKTDVFDAQLAFNMLARYGEEAEEPLDGVEKRAERELASLLAGYPAIPMPSIRFIQAPVFHGHSFSLWVELDRSPEVDAIARAFEHAGISVYPDDPPSNVNAAGQTGISVGAINADPNDSRACWIWAVSDNLRLSASNAIAVMQEVLARRSVS